MTRAKTCSCGRRVLVGQVCVCGAGKPPSEAERIAAQPWRRAYRHPSHRRSNLERYELVGGLCEDCGVPLKGRLHPDGVPWEGDHCLEARHFEDPIAANTVENKRCRCVPCHKKKTRARRRGRGGGS